MGKTKAILVPTDFSKLSDKAVSYAVDIARQEGASIYLLHLIGVIQQCSDVYCLDSTLVEELEKRSSAQAKTLMEKQVRRLPGLKKVHFKASVRSGSPYDGILLEAEKKKIDLIIMGAHKKKGFIDRFLGSVADKVARGAKCPVLLIKS
ncbi:MAG TPA: universal stress protein [Acidobacteriota bacterium]